MEWKGLSTGQGKEENGGKGTGIKKHKWQEQNRGAVKNSIGYEEAKNLMCTSHGHELREGGLLEGRGIPGGGGHGGKNGTTVIA